MVLSTTALLAIQSAWGEGLDSSSSKIVAIPSMVSTTNICIDKPTANIIKKAVKYLSNADLRAILNEKGDTSVLHRRHHPLAPNEVLPSSQKILAIEHRKRLSLL